MLLVNKFKLDEAPPVNPCRCPLLLFLSFLFLFICVRLMLCSEYDFIGLEQLRTVAGFSFAPFCCVASRAISYHSRNFNLPLVLHPG